MHLFVAVILSTVVLVRGASRCPLEKNIKPCVCIKTTENSRNVTNVFCRPKSSTSTTTTGYVDTPSTLDRMLIDRLTFSEYRGEDLQAGWSQGIRVRELQFLDINFKSSRTTFYRGFLKGQELVLTKFTITNSRGVKSLNLSGLDGTVNLTELDLSRNGIDSIYKDDIPTKGLKNLQKLDLSGNKLREVNWTSISFLQNLRVLNLSHNSLKKISAAVERSKPSGKENKTLEIFSGPIEVIDFSYNKIESVSEGLFENLTTGSTVFFQHNYLETLSIEIWLPAVLKANTVDVSENFFVCDCDMAWIDAENATMKNTVSCIVPEKFRFLSLSAFFAAKKCERNVLYTTSDTIGGGEGGALGPRPHQSLKELGWAPTISA